MIKEKLPSTAVLSSEENYRLILSHLMLIDKQIFPDRIPNILICTPARIGKTFIELEFIANTRTIHDDGQCDILIVPAHLYCIWRDRIKGRTDLNVLYVDCEKRLNYSSENKKIKLILINVKLWRPSFLSFLRMNHLQIKNVFVDEPDKSLKIPCAKFKSTTRFRPKAYYYSIQEPMGHRKMSNLDILCVLKYTKLPVVSNDVMYVTQYNYIDSVMKNRLIVPRQHIEDVFSAVSYDEQATLNLVMDNKLESLKYPHKYAKEITSSAYYLHERLLNLECIVCGLSHSDDGNTEVACGTCQNVTCAKCYFRLQCCPMCREQDNSKFALIGKTKIYVMNSILTTLTSVVGYKIIIYEPVKEDFRICYNYFLHLNIRKIEGMHVESIYKIIKEFQNPLNSTILIIRDYSTIKGLDFGNCKNIILTAISNDFKILLNSCCQFDGHVNLNVHKIEKYIYKL
jgi:hypothetical protein